LAGFEAGIDFVDDVKTAFATHYFAVFVSFFCSFKRVENFHLILFGKWLKTKAAQAIYRNWNVNHPTSRHPWTAKQSEDLGRLRLNS